MRSVALLKMLKDLNIYYSGSEETSEPKPVPSLLVGFEQEWLTISPNSVRYWVSVLPSIENF